MTRIWLDTELIEAGSKTQFQIKLPRTELRVVGILVSAMDDSIAKDSLFDVCRGSLWLHDASSSEMFYSEDFKFSRFSYKLAIPTIADFTPFYSVSGIVDEMASQVEFLSVDSIIKSNVINGYYESYVSTKSPLHLKIYLKLEE